MVVEPPELPNALLTVTARVPALIAVVPAYVLAPERVSAPKPSLVNEVPAPEMIPEIVKSLLRDALSATTMVAVAGKLKGTVIEAVLFPVASVTVRVAPDMVNVPVPLMVAPAPVCMFNKSHVKVNVDMVKRPEP